MDCCLNVLDWLAAADSPHFNLAPSLDHVHSSIFAVSSCTMGLQTRILEKLETGKLAVIALDISGLGRIIIHPRLNLAAEQYQPLDIKRSRV